VRPCIKSVVVTFNPDIPLFERCLASVANLCEVIVVDNGSDNLGEIRQLLRRFPNSRLIELGANYGLSAAANAGIEGAKDADWVLFLDQDSVVLCDPAEVVGIAPQERTGAIALNAANRGSQEAFQAIDLSIFSGMLVKAEFFKQGLKFNEYLFLDQTDHEFSWQIRHSGKKILRTGRRCLDHRLGVSKKFLGIQYYGYEPAWRNYFIAKDLTKLFLEKKLTVRFWVSQLILWYLGTMISRSGLGLFALSKGLYDGLSQRRTDIHLVLMLAHAENKSLGDLRIKS